MSFSSAGRLDDRSHGEAVAREIFSSSLRLASFFVRTGLVTVGNILADTHIYNDLFNEKEVCLEGSSNRIPQEST